MTDKLNIKKRNVHVWPVSPPKTTITDPCNGNRGRNSAAGKANA